MAVAISPLPLLLLFCLLAASASARPCKTLFFFSATTTTYYSHPRNPNSPNSIFQIENPNSLTLILTTTTTTRFPDRRPTLSFNSNPTLNDDSQSSTLMTSPNFPLNFVSSSIRDRTKDIMSVVGALLFGVGCGALTAATMYFVWSLFSPHSFDLDDEFSDDDDESDDVTAFKKKLGYVAIPSTPKVVDHDDDLKNPAPAPPAKEMV